MQKNSYFLENNFQIDENDKMIVRTFYLPILGVKTVAIFHLLIDLGKIFSSEEILLNFQHICNHLDIAMDEFKSARKKLEAVGLMRTYKSDYYSKIIFQLIKPLEVNKIKNNKLLSSEIIKKIGVELFDSLISKFKKTEIDKSEFQELTSKFYEEFSLNKNIKGNSVTNNISIYDIKTNEDAKNNLDTKKYIEFLTKKSAMPSLVAMAEKFINHNFSQSAINEILYFCWEANGKINAKYFEKIANDLINKDIRNAIDINLELSEVLSFKKQKLLTDNQDDNFYKSSFEDYEPTKLNFDENGTRTMDIEEIMAEWEMEK